MLWLIGRSHALKTIIHAGYDAIMLDLCSNTYTTHNKQAAASLHSKPSSSTSKTSVALGGMTPGWPLFP